MIGNSVEEPKLDYSLMTDHSLLKKWWRRRGLHPPHAACKAASPLWNMRPRRFLNPGKLAHREGIEPSERRGWSPAAIPTRRRHAWFSFLELNNEFEKATEFGRDEQRRVGMAGLLPTALAPQETSPGLVSF